MNLISIGAFYGVAFVLPLCHAASPGNVAATQVCLPTTAMTPDEKPGTWSEAQRQLGQGIASFDEGRFAVSTEHVKRALRSGLDVPIERAIANKYLALIYCRHQSSALCRKHFEAAVEASSDITFDDVELRTALHRQSLNDARSAIAKRNTKSVANISTPTTLSTKEKSSQSGTLRLDIRPWAEILVNDRSVGVTPPSKSITLAAGEHRLEIRNPAGPPLRAAIKITTGGSVELAHRF
jgi:hypothetical protein